jgi:hypothetical protein
MKCINLTNLCVCVCTYVQVLFLKNWGGGVMGACASSRPWSVDKESCKCYETVLLTQKQLTHPTHFDPEDGGCMTVQNISNITHIHMV